MCFGFLRKESKANTKTEGGSAWTGLSARSPTNKRVTQRDWLASHQAY